MFKFKSAFVFPKTISVCKPLKLGPLSTSYIVLLKN